MQHDEDALFDIRRDGDGNARSESITTKECDGTDMPPALALNPESGFLDSPNSLSSFSTPKKLRFFELADEYRKNTGKWPDTGSLCESVGVSMRCFYHHLELDRHFKSEWEERLLRGEARLTAQLHDASHPIAKLAWLRRYFPERWSPVLQGAPAAPSEIVIRLAKEMDRFVDAEVVPPTTKPVP